MKQNQHFFFQKSSLNSFEVNFTVQSYASLTYEDSAYLQISYHCVYYLKYSELKSFFGHRVGAPKPVYRLLNPSGYVWDWTAVETVWLLSSIFRCSVLHMQCRIQETCETSIPVWAPKKWAQKAQAALYPKVSLYIKQIINSFLLCEIYRKQLDIRYSMAKKNQGNFMRKHATDS